MTLLEKIQEIWKSSKSDEQTETEIKELIKNSKRDEVCDAIKKQPFLFTFAQDYSNDEEIVRSIVSTFPDCLNYTSKDLREKMENESGIITDEMYAEEVEEEAVEDKPKTKEEIVNEIIAECNKIASEPLSKEEKESKINEVIKPYSDDRDVILGVVKTFGSAIMFASDRLKDDREVAVTAVTDCSFALLHVSDDRKDDEKVVLIAIKDNSSNLKYASERMQQKYKDKTDKEIEEAFDNYSEKEEELAVNVSDVPPIPHPIPVNPYADCLIQRDKKITKDIFGKVIKEETVGYCFVRYNPTTDTYDRVDNETFATYQDATLAKDGKRKEETCVYQIITEPTDTFAACHKGKDYKERYDTFAKANAKLQELIADHDRIL